MEEKNNHKTDDELTIKPDTAEKYLSNYKYNELLFKYNINYDYGADDDYITLDMTRFYTNMLINTTFYEFSLIMPF